MDTDNERWRLSEDVTFQSMGPGEATVLLSLSSGYLYTCNETTESFLRALNGQRTFDEIVEALAGQYEVDEDRLRADLIELAEELLKEKLIVTEPSPQAEGSGK